MFRIYVLLALVAVCLANDYCSPELCRSGKHTLCKYDAKVNRKNCKNTIERKYKVGVTDEEKKIIVEEHNKWRRKVAKGEDGIINRPAADMMEFEWDDDVAEVAQGWANQCTYKHDDCRTPKTKGANNDGRCFKRAGQNMAIRTYGGVDWPYAIKMWYDEIKDYKPEWVEKFTSGSAPNGKVIGHFTAMIWARTWKIGCGFIEYDGIKPFRWFGARLFYVCNYADAPNIKTRRVYLPDKVCSKCPENSTCNDGLCKLN